MKAKTIDKGEISKFKAFVAEFVHIRTDFDLEIQDCGTLIFNPTEGEIKYTTLSGLGIYTLKDGILTFSGRRKSFSDGIHISDYLHGYKVSVFAQMYNDSDFWEITETSTPYRPL